MSYGGRSASLPVGTVTSTENVAQWGGVPVEPAAPKTDGQSNAANVPEVGARLQGFDQNAPAPGAWDMLRAGLTAQTATPVGFMNILPFGQFNAAPPILAAGQSVVLQLDSNGNLKVSVTNIVTIAGTVTANQGAATGAAGAWSVRLSDGAAFYDATKTGQLPAALVGGRLDTNVGAWLGSTAPTVGQKIMAESVPVVLASDQTAIAVTTTPVAPVGAEGNAWLAAVVAAGGFSASIDLQFTPFVTVFGNADGQTIITAQFSQDDIAFYSGPTTVVPGGGSDFHMLLTLGSRYLRLRSSQARTITATIAAKD